MAELGQTNDPTELIPGDPNTIYTTIQELNNYGDLLTLAGQGLQRIDSTAGWSGDAADAFRKRFTGHPDKWLRAGGAFHTAAQQLQNYVPTLVWAQGQATDAINQWNSGQQNHATAQQTLSHARGQLESVGDTAATAVGKARDLAPPKPGFWSSLGSSVGGFFSGLGHDAEAAGAALVNGAASIGNAAIHDPTSLAATAGGIGLMALGAAGTGAGGVLTLSVVGSEVGIPLAGVSIAGITVGAGLTAAGIGGIISDAAGPDRVNIMHMDSGGNGGADRPPEDLRSSEGSIGNKMGYSRKQIKDAIHAVKNNSKWRGIGGNRNPDVVVDVNSGEVYPELPNGEPAEDSIGNILEYLPEPDEG
jgi:exonuclease VII small subunit